MNLESHCPQACHLIPFSYLISCFSAQSCCSLCLVIFLLIIIIIKRISRAPIYHTKWSTGHFTITLTTCMHAHTHARTHTHVHIQTHKHTHTHTHTHTHVSDRGIGMAVKNSLEIVIEQVRLEGSFKRGCRIRVVVCLRQWSILLTFFLQKGGEVCVRGFICRDNES